MLDDYNDLYISDGANNKVRYVNPAGIISTIAGNGVNGYSGDGGPATSAELSPNAIAVSSTGSIYIAVLRRIREVLWNGPLRAKVTSVNSTSCSVCNGSASASVFGGHTPYTYNWTPGGSTISSPTGLCAGTYTLTVTDSLGASIQQIITLGPSLNDSIKSITSGCANNNGTATVYPYTGMAPYTYLWSDGGTASNIVNLSGGTYSVTVTDALGCSQNNSVIVPQGVTFTISQTNISCSGANNGTASVINVAGGVAPYTYNWSPSGGTSSVASGLSAGTNTVSVTDMNGCNSTASVSITQPAPLKVKLLNDSLDYLCDYDTKIYPVVSGGTAPYTYYWTPNGNSGPYTLYYYTGVYSVRVTDANGCKDSASCNIQSFSAGITIKTLTNVSCYGDSNGSVTVTYGGNIPVWHPLGTNPAKLKAGIYTVTDSNRYTGCTGAIKITITQPAQLVVSASVMQHGICAVVYDSAYSNVSGGTTPYTYSWSGGHGTKSYVTDLSAGTYTVNVTDHNGCSASAFAIITQPALLSVSANTILNVSCNGGSNGSAFSVASGGGPPYTYSWSGGGGTNTNTSGLSAANYTVTVSDSCGNSATASVSITQPNALSVSANTTANVSCNGGNNGSASSIISGGSSPYSYLWSDGNSQTTSSATGLTMGTYTVSVSDFCGSTMTASVSITQPISLSVSASTTLNVSCNGGNNGSATSSVSGGTSPYTYTWSNGPNSPDISALSAGTYNLNVTDNNGCIGTASVIITQPSALIVSANTTSNVICNGGSDGSASSSVSGGAAPYAYSWSNSQNTPNISSLSAGTYTLNVSDNNGCTGSASVIITLPPSLNVSANILLNVSCNAGANGSASSSVSGGTAPYTYSWSNSQSIPNISSLSAGTYSLTVTDNNGCTASASVIITQPIALSIIADSINANNGCTGSAWAIVNGGVSPYSYLWTGGATTDTIQNQCAGNYCITITDANGCIDSACTSINIFLGEESNLSNNGLVIIYPNPNNGQFILQLASSYKLDANSQVQVYDMLGQEIYNSNINSSGTQIDLGNKASGIYLYRVITETGGITGEGKFIIE